jgi:putative hydrolase of the HAD superfamily
MAKWVAWMIEIIGFDADDTLWDNEILYSQAKDQFQDLVSPYGTPRQVRQRLDEIEERNVRHYGYGIKSFALSMIEAAIEISDGQIEASRLSKLIDIVKEMLRAEVKPLEPVEPTLAVLAQHYPLMLVTKGDFFEQHRKIERSGLAKYFRYIEIVIDKTPDTYRSVLAKYHLEPNRFLMVGNSLRSDILPVLEIGGQAVYIPYAGTWAHEDLDESTRTTMKYIEIEHLGQLPGLLDNL